jgi:Zn-dependent peptidase ImmA (M78 family)
LKSFSDLRCFCEYIANKYGSPDNASEDEKAKEFRNVYLRNLPPNLRALRAVASACGIHVNRVDGKKLPGNMRGYHDVFDDNRNIYYKEDDTLSGIENTILHEFREMIEPVFAEVCLDYKPLRTSAVHLVANKFATAVLLPTDEFREKVYENGFDVIELSRLYSKSCSQVLLRMGEVLQGRLFMYAALYEADAENQWRVTYWTGSCNDADPDANVYGANELFPRKGRAVVPGSLVDMVIQARKPYLAQHITFLNTMDDEGLVALASPLNISGILAKVVLVVLLGMNRDLLAAQIERSRPTIVEGFHQHL